MNSMPTFSLSQFMWIMRLRAISVGSLLVVLSVLLVGHWIPAPLQPYLVLVVSVAFVTWMLTAPLATFPCIAGFRPSLIHLFARKRSLRTMPSLIAIAEEMGAPLPKVVRVLKSDKINAGVNGNTLFITEALEPLLWTSLGRAILAHELAHSKRHHTYILLVMLTVAFTISWLFGVHFWPIHEGIGFAMGLIALLTIASFILPVASRKMEYDADARASDSIGPDAMIEMLRAIDPFGSRSLEADSHPSTQARIRRLQSNRALKHLLARR